MNERGTAGDTVRKSRAMARLLHVYIEGIERGSQGEPNLRRRLPKQQVEFREHWVPLTIEERSVLIQVVI